MTPASDGPQDDSEALRDEPRPQSGEHTDCAYCEAGISEEHNEEPHHN